MSAARSLGRLDAKHTLFVLCDLQERFRTVAFNFPAIITNAQKLLSCGKLLDVNLIVSEQVPDKLGHTVAELNITHANVVYAKHTFSIMNDPKLKESILKMANIRSFVLFGLETHICIEQTATDFLDAGYDVHIVADCTTSRSSEDRSLAFQRLRQMGCFVTTSENVIFKLMGSKNHPQFAQIVPLVRNVSIESGLH